MNEKLKLNLVEFLKGLLIGIAILIPGVCSGSLACVLGVYEKLITNINQFAKHPIKSIKNLFFLGIGLVIGVAISFFLIAKLLLPLFPLEMSFLFAGLIIGGSGSIRKKFSGSYSTSKTSIIASISLSILLMAGICALNFFGFGSKTITYDFPNLVIMFVLGMLAAFSMIVPGLSGSVILLALGYYLPLIDLISTTAKDTLALNITGNTVLFVTLIAGAVIGVLSSTKAVKYLLEKHPVVSYSTIYGLLIGSVISVFVLGIKDFEFTTIGWDIAHFVVSGLLLCLGVYAGTKLEKLDENKTEEKEV